MAPRNGHTLVVGIVARISGCANQREVSLDDQVDHAKQEVADLCREGGYAGPVGHDVIATRGEGERLDRPELGDVERALRRRAWDLLVVEDLGRLVRGTEASRLVGLAVDHGTRVIAINDCIDTAGDDAWEADVIGACGDHVGHNTHTSKRLKHKLTRRFERSGGCVPCEVYGYEKPPGCQTYDDLRKVEAATPVYQEWFRRLLVKPNCSAVADWLNARGVPTGPHARKDRWDGKMVRRLTRNPVLIGMPGRGFRRTVKVHEHGRRVSVPNPDGPTFREHPYPHLAHVDADLFDAVNARLDAANAGSGRKRGPDGLDPLDRVPRDRSRCPGRHARCWYCGREYVWGGNGVPGHLMCGGAREWRCWNSVGFDGSRAARLVAAELSAALAAVDGVADQFRALVEAAARDGGGDLPARRRKLRTDRDALARALDNVGDAVAQLGPRPALAAKLDELEARGRALDAEERAVAALEGRRLEIPSSADDLRRMLAGQLDALAADSHEFADLARQLVPSFEVYLVRLCDGGHPLPRARVRLDLAGSVPDAARVPGLAALLTREVTLDLFDRPPQRERIRAKAVELARHGLEQREIAAHPELPELATQTAVSAALGLDRAARERGLASAYVTLDGPPDDYPRLRRHRNPKYRFEPLAAYARRPL